MLMIKNISNDAGRTKLVFALRPSEAVLLELIPEDPICSLSSPGGSSGARYRGSTSTLCCGNQPENPTSISPDSRAGSSHAIKQTLAPHFYLTFYLAVTNEQQLDYNIVCLLFITGTKDTIH